MIEVRLKEAFMQGLFNSKISGESVDVYSNNIKRLAGLAGYMGRGLNQTVSFCDRLPRYHINDTATITGREQNENYKPYTNYKGIDKNTNLDSRVVGAVTRSKEPTNRCQGPHRLRDCKVPPRTKIMCYNCKKFGYIPLFRGTAWRWQPLLTLAVLLLFSVPSLLMDMVGVEPL